MFTIYEGKKVTINGEFLLPRGFIIGFSFGSHCFVVALGIVAISVDWTGGDDD